MSVDVVVNDTLGDISRPETQAFWIGSIRSRWTIALFTGPPCETWSIARSKQVHPKKRGPRVIRTLDAIWGKRSTSQREHCQLQIGNLLMHFSIEALYELYCQQGFGALEHPGEPEDPEAASIWRTAVMQMLLTLPGIRVYRLSQGYWGAFSSKPTDLLTIRLPQIDRRMTHWQLTTTLPQTASIGQSESGAYLTSKLKEYPPAVCGALADSFGEALHQYRVSTVDSPPADFLIQCTAMVQDLNTEDLHHMGQDFAG